MSSTPRVQPLFLLSLLVGCAGASTPVRSTTPVAQPVTVAMVSPTVRSISAPVESSLWESVENPAARYIAVLGAPTAHDDSVREDQLIHAHRHAARTLQSFNDLELAPQHFDRAKLMEESTRRKLPGVAFECGVVRHEVDARGTHFTVNVTVVDLRTEDIVATLAGSATAPGPTGPDSEQDALEGALEGAMRAVPRLLASLEPMLVAQR